jgi:hypothetical protein
MHLKIAHPYGDYNGFFSNCSIKLENIINHYNKYNCLAKIVDSSKLFYMYKINKMDDITYHFFENENNIDVNIESEPKKNMIYDGGIIHMQYKEYKKIDFDNINLFIKKYFTPSNEIIHLKNFLINKYNINPEEYIGVYYRGTDKIKEINLCEFEQFELKLKEILTINNKLKILLLTDSKQVLDYFKIKFPNITFINENKVSSNDIGIHYENNSETNYIDIKYLFATFLILSKCKYYICGSSNGALWTLFYRNNSYNVYQNSNNIWLN